MNPNDGRAVVEDDALIIRLPLKHLAQAIEKVWTTNDFGAGWKLKDVNAFARDLVTELNREDEDGCTMVNYMLNAAINEVSDKGWDEFMRYLTKNNEAVSDQ